MAEAIYALCALTSGTCAILLLRKWRRTRERLLLWSGLCFAGLAANNALLYVDIVLVPTVDLSVPRGLIALAAMITLVFGLVWESR